MSYCNFSNDDREQDWEYKEEERVLRYRGRDVLYHGNWYGVADFVEKGDSLKEKNIEVLRKAFEDTLDDPLQCPYIIFVDRLVSTYLNPVFNAVDGTAYEASSKDSREDVFEELLVHHPDKLIYWIELLKDHLPETALSPEYRLILQKIHLRLLLIDFVDRPLFGETKTLSYINDTVNNWLDIVQDKQDRFFFGGASNALESPNKEICSLMLGSEDWFIKNLSDLISNRLNRAGCNQAELTDQQEKADQENCDNEVLKQLQEALNRWGLLYMLRNRRENCKKDSLSEDKRYRRETFEALTTLKRIEARVQSATSDFLLRHYFLSDALLIMGAQWSEMFGRWSSFFSSIFKRRMERRKNPVTRPVAPKWYKNPTNIIHAMVVLILIISFLNIGEHTSAWQLLRLILLPLILILLSIPMFLTNLYPFLFVRLGGVLLVGMVPLMISNDFWRFIIQAQPWRVVLLGAISLVGIYLYLFMEVNNKLSRVLSHIPLRQVIKQTFTLFELILIQSYVLSSIVNVLFFKNFRAVFQYDPSTNHTIWWPVVYPLKNQPISFPMIFVVAILGSAIGILVQGLWDEKSLTEPV